MVLRLITFTICIITLLFGHTHHAQENNSGVHENSLVTEYKNFFSKTHSILSELISENKEEVPNLWKDLVENKQIFTKQNQNNFPILDRGMSFSNIGLKWVSDANYNFSPGITDIEDLVSRYRVSTGLDWVILGEGSWMKHKQDLNVLRTRAQRDSVFNSVQDTKFSIKDKLNLIQTVFDKSRIELIEKYKEWVQESTRIYDLMVKNKLIHHSEKIKEEQKLIELNNQLEFYNSYLEKTDNFLIEQYKDLPKSFNELPNWKDIREEDLLKDREQLIEIQKEILDIDKRNSELPSLRAKLRYNYYDFEREGSRSFASIGLSLSVPIQSKKDKLEVQYQKHQYNTQLIVEKAQLKEELFKHHRNFYALKNKIEKLKNESHYLQVLMDNELKIHEDDNKLFSPKKYIQHAEQWIEKRLEILDAQQSLCEEYLVFYALSGLIPHAEIENKTNEKVSKKSTYLWKKEFYTSTNQEINNFLRKNNIETILISPGDSIQKTKEFIQLATSNNIKVERLLSENSYALSDENAETLLHKLESLKDLNYSGVHLNIEPHTFSDYKENIGTYTQRMNRIYKIAHQWCLQNNKTLSVSIPMHLPIENAQFLAEHKIKAYIMAYDNKNQLRLLEHTENLRNIIENQYVWVLKLVNFENKEEILQIENELKSNGIENIAYYDFSAVKQML